MVSFVTGLLSVILVVLGTIGGLIYGSAVTDKLVDNIVWHNRQFYWKASHCPLTSRVSS